MQRIPEVNFRRSLPIENKNRISPEREENNPSSKEHPSKRYIKHISIKSVNKATIQTNSKLGGGFCKDCETHETDLHPLQDELSRLQNLVNDLSYLMVMNNIKDRGIKCPQKIRGGPNCCFCQTPFKPPPEIPKITATQYPSYNNKMELKKPSFVRRISPAKYTASGIIAESRHSVQNYNNAYHSISCQLYYVEQQEECE